MKNQNAVVFGGVAMLAGMTGASAQELSPLFKIGSVDVRPHAAYKVIYDDNVFLEHKKSNVIGPNNDPGRDHDFIHTITPGVRLNAGDAGARETAYMNADYEAGIQKFTNHKGSDALDHNAHIELGTRLNHLKISLDQTFQLATAADVRNQPALGRVQHKTWNTKADFAYDISEKTKASLETDQSIADYSGAMTDSVDRQAHLFLDYQVLPKVSMGLGGGAGYLQAEGNSLIGHNPNSVYWDGLARLNWAAAEKLNLSLKGGVQDRHVQERGFGDDLGFVFRAAADWKATERTTVSVSGARETRASNSIGASVSEDTGGMLTVTQALFDKLSLTLEGGYMQSHYTTTSVTPNLPGVIRNDEYYFMRGALAYKISQRARAEASYRYQRNNCDLALNVNDFYGSQIALELSYRF